MQKAILLTEDGNKKQVFLLDEQDVQNSQNFNKKNWREHLYMGYLIVGTVAFALGIAISLKRLNGSK